MQFVVLLSIQLLLVVLYVLVIVYCSHFFFFKQKTASYLRFSDWSSDVCSSDLRSTWAGLGRPARARAATVDKLDVPAPPIKGVAVRGNRVVQHASDKERKSVV